MRNILRALLTILFVLGCAGGLNACCACGGSNIRCPDQNTPPSDACSWSGSEFLAGTCSCPSVTRCHGTTRCVHRASAVGTTPCCSSDCGGNCQECTKTTYPPLGQDTCGQTVNHANCLMPRGCVYI